MTNHFPLRPGVVLRHCRQDRFKKSALSIQFLRPMCAWEAALNALLPAVLLRGSAAHPDLRTITWRLDELYGASVSTMVRRIGNVQTVGFYCSFMEDRYAFEGDQVLVPMLSFLRELLLEPVLRDGCFLQEYVDSEKKNLISTIESELNDKRAYAAGQMLRHMCQGDSFSIPRLGKVKEVEAITNDALFAHYLQILKTSPIEIFYVGSAASDTVIQALTPLVSCLADCPSDIPAQNLFIPSQKEQELFETMDVSQAKLCMGFHCGIGYDHPDYAAMQVFNTLYGAGMTSKLFVNVRERLSLCYYANSSYYGAKGIMTVSCGIDEENESLAKQEILAQLEACQSGQITQEELSAAKSTLLSSLRSIPDSPGSLEGFYATASIGGIRFSIDEYMAAISRVSAQDVQRAAQQIKLHTTYCLKGVSK